MSAITIKELLPSDPLSQLAEKVNFNFDQLMLAGGGPQGIQGFTGPSGPPGPLGKRGSLWWSGGTSGGVTMAADGSELSAGDQTLESDGDIYRYFEITGASGWTYSGINIMGPTGPSGSTGSSFEWQYYPGFTGGVQDSNTYGPTTGDSSTTSSPNVDFIVPRQGGKNAVFLGDRIWAYTSLGGFNTYPAGTDQTDVPKLTLIQDRVSNAGQGGMAFGAVALATGVSGSDLPAVGDLSAAVDAFDFVHLGFIREPVALEYHRFRINSYRAPLSIQVGGDDVGYRAADLDVRARQVRIQDYNYAKSISAFSVPMTLNAGVTQSYIEVLAKPDNFTPDWGNISPAGTAGYLALQSTAGYINGTRGDGVHQVNHSFGTVFIGPTYSFVGQYRPFVLADPAGLVVSRPVTTISNNVDAHIKLYSPTVLPNGVNDYVVKMVGSYAPFDSFPSAANFQIAGRRVAINHKFDQNDSRYMPRFPFHINQRLENLAVPAAWLNMYSDPRIQGWAFGIDSYNSNTGLYRTKGLGVAYSTAVAGTFGGDNREIILQTYYTGAATPPNNKENSPHLHMQIGDERHNGNLFLGGMRRLDGLNALDPKSKLSVLGSITVGSSAAFSGAVPIAATGAIRAEGPMLQGTMSYAPTTDLLTFAQLVAAIGSTYGFYSTDKVLGSNFIATRNGASFAMKAPSFALPDALTGIRGATYNGEGIMQAYKATGFSEDIARWSTRGEDGTDSLKGGFQVIGRMASKVQYIDSRDMVNLCQPISGPTGSGNWALCTIPVSKSVIKFQGNGFHYYPGPDYTLPWKTQYEEMNGIPYATCAFVVELEAGAYDGQELEIVFTGWGNRSLFFGTLPAFSFYNDARYLFPTKNPLMLLSKEYNGGGYSSSIGGGPGSDGTDGWGLPYPYPHGAQRGSTSITTDFLSGNAGVDTYWSTAGQFTAFGYRTLKLRWMTHLPDSPPNSGLFKQRWVEISRTHLSRDMFIAPNGNVGDTGYTV